MKLSSTLRIPFKWENRHPILLDRCLYIPGFFDRHDSWQPIAWEDPQIFGNHNPIHMEFCSGNGQWICEKAKKNPHINFVAVEKRFDRARKIWANLKRDNITNLLVVCSDDLIYAKHYVPLNSVSYFYINFPDPWPKLRHAKHRLMRPEFLKVCERIVTDHAMAMFTTDDTDYANLAVSTLLESSFWKPKHLPPYLICDLPDFGDSYFCDLWKSKGKNIYHLQFEKAL